MSPLGAAQGFKPWITHDLSFPPARDRMTVNHPTDFEKAPRLGLGHDFPDALTQIMYLQQRFGPSAAHIVFHKLDVKTRFGKAE